MATAKQVGPAATLPADFGGWDAPAATGGAPASLPSDFGKWDDPTPPTSGAIGPSKVPSDAVPQSLTNGGSTMDSALGRTMQGINGIKKGLVSTAQNIHNSNYSMIPKDSPFAQPLPFANVDTKAYSPDEQAGKFTEGLAELAVPMGEGKNVLQGAKSMLPSAERSGAQLGRMSKYLQGVPVHLNEAIPALDRAAEVSKAGGGPLGSAGNLLQRSQQAHPMDFPEARDYYPNISSLSAEEKMSMKPALRRQIGSVRQAFHNDLANTADKILPPTQRGYFGQAMNGGKGDYENAVDEYHHAMQLKDAGNTLVKKVLPAGGVIGGGKMIYDKLRGH